MIKEMDVIVRSIFMLCFLEYFILELLFFYYLSIKNIYLLVFFNSFFRKFIFI